MPFAPFPPAMRHAALPATELRKPRPYVALPPLPVSRRPQIAAGSDPEAARDWAAQVEAGLIGAPSPAPATPGDLRLASLAAIFGPRRAARW